MAWNSMGMNFVLQRPHFCLHELANNLLYTRFVPGTWNLVTVGANSFEIYSLVELGVFEFRH